MLLLDTFGSLGPGGVKEGAGFVSFEQVLAAFVWDDDLFSKTKLGLFGVLKDMEHVIF